MKRSTLSRAAALPAAFVLTLGLAACGAENEGEGETGDGGGEESSDLSGTLDGAGASSQAAAMEAWIAGFTEIAPDLQVNYDPAGSGAGREQFIAGGTTFAGSDAYLDDEELPDAEERCGGEGQVIELPLYVSPIAVIYNLEGVEDLQLSPATIAGMFAQQITNWNDPAIAADNPDATLPDQAITPVNRSDESGTTENFTEYLSATAPDVWTEEPSGDWPFPGGEAAQGTSGVVGAVQSGVGSVGYADASQAGELGVALIGVGEEFVAFSPEAAAAVVDASTPVEGRGEFDFAIDVARDTTEAGTYPIVLVAYTIACTVYDDEADAANVAAFIEYLASEDGQTAAAEAAGSAPISETTRENAATAVEAISAG